MKSPLFLLLLSLLAIIAGIYISNTVGACHKNLHFFCGAAASWGILGLREYDRICGLKEKQNNQSKE